MRPVTMRHDEHAGARETPAGRKRFFVSFNSEDRAWAEWVAWITERAGHEVAFQDWDMPPGSDFVEEMHRASADCDATIAVLSPSYLKSEFAAAEWRVAFARDPSGAGRRLIPVRVLPCDPEGLLKTRVYLDLVGRDRESASRLLLRALAGARTKPDEEPAFPSTVTSADAIAPPAGDSPEAPVFPGRPDAFEDYRNWALDRHGRLELIGLGAGGFLFDLDEFYVPLRMAPRPWDPGEGGLLGRRRMAADEGTDGDVTLERAVEIARGEGRDVAIVGDAGAGKTTALRKLLHQTLTAGGASLGLPPATVPVFLRLRRLDRAQLDRPVDAFLERELNEEAPGRFPAGFAADLWRRGDVLLLLDGLDEIPEDTLRSSVCRWLDRALTGMGKRGVHAVLSTRRSGLLSGVTLPGRFLPVEVRPLDDRLIARLVHTWFRAARRALEPLPERRADAEARARAEAESLIATLRDREASTPQLLELISTPLFLTLLCIVVVVHRRQIPSRRTQFYHECMEVLLGRWLMAKDIDPLVDVDDAFALLRGVAYALHAAGRRDDLTAAQFESLTNAQISRIGRRLRRPLAASDVLHWLHRGASVLTEYAPDRFGFAHLGLQEYLAAAHIAKEGGEALDALAARFGEEWWRETTLLLLGLPGYSVFTPLLRKVASSGPVVAEIALLRRCLDEAHEPSATPFLEILADERADDSRRAAILRLFVGRRETEVAVAAQALVAHPNADISALARRLGEEAGLELPPITREIAPAAPGWVAGAALWVEPTTGMRFLAVPGGRFVMGADNLGDASQPPHPVRVSPFWLAETPVTNQQYRDFLEATQHPEPVLWRDRRFSAAEQPVVGVSWDDAVAFCAWLSKRCGRALALPSEAQWEFAARGLDGRPYPWGPEPPDASRAVYGLDWQHGQPAAVGSVPGGRGPFGHLDLAGNVWEWCADVWDPEAYRRRAKQRGEPIDPIVSSGDTSYRSLRGGGWVQRGGGSCAPRTASGTSRSSASTTSAFALPPRPRARLFLDFLPIVRSGSGRVQGRSPWSLRKTPWTTILSPKMTRLSALVTNA